MLGLDQVEGVSRSGGLEERKNRPAWLRASAVPHGCDQEADRIVNLSLARENRIVQAEHVGDDCDQHYNDSQPYAPILVPNFAALSFVMVMSQLGFPFGSIIKER